MSGQRRARSTRALLTSVMLLLAVALAVPLSARTDANALYDAWDRAMEAGGYGFSAAAEQRFIPRPIPSMIGQRDQQVELRMDGQVTLPDVALLRLRFEGAGLDNQALTLVQEGTETYLLQDGERIPLDNPAGLASPTADYLGYLSGAENIRQLPSEEDGLARYAFDLNGFRFSEHVRRTMAGRPRDPAAPALPPGVELQPPALLQRLTGTGELWVDSEGLPKRQILDLNIPRASDQYDAQVHLVVDFDFGPEAAVAPTAERQTGVVALPRPVLRVDAGQAVAFLLLVFLFAALVTRNRRGSYRWLAATVSVILVLTPLLQVAGIVAYEEHRSRAGPAEEVLRQALSTQNPPEPQEDAEASPSPAAPSVADVVALNGPVLTGVPVPEPSHKCGDGVPGVDTDNDGLLDVSEYCLGTDPFYFDTDRDMITDTLEADGFDWDGQHWPLNPFQTDSNSDGIADGAEWIAPIGDAPSLDVDGDGVPNVWDRDNDNDGVPDNLDLSPFTRTGVVSEFRFHSQSAGPGDYQYVEIQIRPNNPDHLRFTTASLDWPFDNEGQIQDLDGSPDDLRLIPLLEVLANRAPDEELGNKYGLSSFGNTGDAMYPYRLVAPLAPVGDGGDIVAWYTKVPYEPSHLNNIMWRQARVVWVLQADVDQWAAGRVQYETVPVQTYVEPSFRVTGLQVTRSRGLESAILGTPGVPRNDQQLFNLLFGLSTTFLHTEEPDLATVETRFTDGSTPPEERWGVTASVWVDREVYDHRDAGLAGTSQRINDFLDLGSYHLFGDAMASIIVAYQEDIGAYNVDDKGQWEIEANFYANIPAIPINTMRGLKLGLYHYDGDSWDELTLGQALPAIQARYADVTALLASLQVQYPELTEEQLRGVLYLFYATWSIGQSRVIALEGVVLPPDTHPDGDVFDRYARPGVSDLPAYLIDIADLGQEGSSLRIGVDPGQVWDYLRDYGQEADEIGFYDQAVQFLGVDSVISGEDAEFIVGVAKKLLTNVLAFKTVVQAVTWARSAAGSWSGLMSPTKMSGASGRMLGAIGCAVSVGMIWLQFALTTDFSDPIALKTALVYAIVATVVVVVLFVISLNPVGAILVAVFALIDLLVYVATWLILGEGISIQEEMIKAIADFFYSADVITYLDSIDFSDLEAVKPDEGLIEGSTFIVRDTFTGKIVRLDPGSLGDLFDSEVVGWLTGGSTYHAVDTLNIGASTCTVSGDVMTCRNDTSVIYNFPTARRDARLEVESRVHAKTFYEESTLGGGITWRSDKVIDLPEEDSDEEPIVIYLDILPDTLQKVWDWADIDNPDEDGDRLPKSQEQALGTRWTMWDTDCDGLSDNFEYEQRGRYGTRPLNAYSDGDDLPDGLEYRIGTRVDQADSDGDGLMDSEEIYFQKQWIYAAFDVCNQIDQEWLGGWDVWLPGRVDPVHVLSHPQRADGDGDGLSDASEKANATSPYAYNAAPRMTLEAQPLSVSPLGQQAVWLESGQTTVMTVTVDNIGTFPITDTLTLCLPDFLIDLQGGVMTGDSTPPSTAPVTCSNGLAWSFAGEDALQRFESASAVLTATVSSPASDSGVALATLPFIAPSGEADVLLSQVQIVVDREDPWVAIVSPVEGALLGRGTHSWVVGGQSGDDSSWVTEVTVELPGAGTVTAEGTATWAATWSIPADGDYTLTAHALDYLAHVSPPHSVNVRVDNTPPEVSLDLAPGEILAGSGGDEIVVALEGTATDNLSGLVRVQISLDGRPWREVWSGAGTPTSLPWSFDWRLPDADSAQGYHSVALRAFDLAGNISDPVERQVLVDVLPPTSELVRAMGPEDAPRVQTGQPVDFEGVANDAGNAPLPARPVELVGTVDSIEDATIWLGPDDIGDNDLGVQVTWLGDFNGDRLADLAVGLPGGHAQGKVSVVYGRAGDWPIPPEREALHDSPSSFVGETITRPAGERLGQRLAPAGDVNGDGLSDLLIGDPAADRLYVIFGATGYFGRDVTMDGPHPAVWSVLTVPGAEVGRHFGPAGDVNGDGFDDLLVGATTATEGTAYLLLGHANPWWDRIDVSVHAAARIAINATGATLTGVGNRNNDPDDEYDDFAIAQASTVYVFPGEAFGARALEWLSLSDPDVVTFASADATPRLAALGDVDADGRSDFVYSSGANPVLVRGTGTTLALVRSPAASGFLAAPGDVDADGRDDILAGNGADDAYLFLENASQVVTIEGVQTGASAPYASGADLNSDGSSDLLLVPHPTHAADVGLAAVEYGAVSYIPPSALPQSASMDVALAPGQDVRAQAVTLYVDDDYCATCPNDGHTWNVDAFQTITNALQAAAADDTVQVGPGRYDPFVVRKSDVTVSGVHPDAVFIDGRGGSYAARVQNATGVTLEKLTLRNAASGVYLDYAGAGGAVDASKRTTLDHLLVYGITAHGLEMDRKSTVDLHYGTLSTDIGTQALVHVRPPTDTVLSLGQFSVSGQPNLSNGNGLTGHSIGIFKFLFAISGNYIYRCRTDGSVPWEQIRTLPSSAHGGSVNASGDSLVAHGGELYAMFIEELLGSPTVYWARFFRLGSGGWAELAAPSGVYGFADLYLTRLASDGNHIYWMTDGWWPDLHRYDVATDTWTQLESAVDFTVADRAMVGANGKLYINALYQEGGAGGTLDSDRHIFEYNPATTTLTKLAPIPASGSEDTMPMVWDGGHYIYGWYAGANAPLLRYDMDLGADPTAWQNLGTLAGTVSQAARLARMGSTFYLALAGGASTIYTFPPRSLAIDHSAFVADPTLATAQWLNLDLSAPSEGFGVAAAANNGWAAGAGTAWSPTTTSTPLTWDQAAFLDAARDVYRLTPASSLSAGYHTYRDDATVSAPGGGGEFTQVQQAINSGANTAVILPGAFSQPFYLLSGVTVVGSGAELTQILAPSGNTSSALVRAEAVVGAHLAGVSLVGDGVVDGLMVEDGARYVRASRNVIRGAADGILVRGSGTDLEAFNNTIVGNNRGMVATGAPLDVRNTIFAHNTTHGLRFTAAVAPIVHRYNDFWQNGTNLSPNSPDPSELFLDPLFSDPVLQNYRLTLTSPMIDAGNPTDIAPPGAGSRVDIGYHELGRAAYYVDEDYCWNCLNDGLTWKLDAFDTIGGALKRARDVLNALLGVVPEGGFTVAVREGIYQERVTVPSYTHLMGSGPADTLLVGTGVGSPVTFDGAVHSQVSGFWLVAGGSGGGGVRVTGGSNAITITRNLITNNATGIRFDGRGTGTALFNTVSDNTGAGVLATGVASRAVVRNNILEGNQYGLQTQSSGSIAGNYNLLYNNSGNYQDDASTGLAAGLNDVFGSPQFTTDYRITPPSAARDRADPVEPVPLGGGLRADIGYHELLAAPVTLLLGREDVSTATGNSGVAEVQVGVARVLDLSLPCTATVPSAGGWTTLPPLSGETTDEWQWAYTPTQQGLHRFYSRATDVAGNQEIDQQAWCDGAFVADGTAPTVDLLAPTNGSSTTSPLELRGRAADYDLTEAFNVHYVYFVVDGKVYPASWSADPWTPDAGSGAKRPFRAWVTLGNGSHTVRAVAQDRAGNVGQSALATFTVTGQTGADTTPPVLTVATPTAGGWVTPTVAFAGTATDAGSGVASVEVSTDGGVLWMPATLSGANWSLTWESGVQGEMVSFPTRVRARDRAGNTTTTAFIISVDNLCPSGPTVYEFDHPPGWHWDGPFWLWMRVDPPIDASGTAEAVRTVDPFTNTTPSTVFSIPTPNYITNVLVSGLGDRYLHIGGRDAAGNICARHYGPWHVGYFGGNMLQCADYRQTIILDGFLDVANDEWRYEYELLDDDERPEQPQSLYFTYDGLALYLGWQGATWPADGEMWGYLATGGAATSTPAGGLAGQIPSLPFAADYAVQVISRTEGLLWHYDGSSWTSGPLSFAHGNSLGTEIRLPMNVPALAGLRLFAFALDSEHSPWAVFPTNNPLAGPWSEHFEWFYLCAVNAPNAGQPRGVGIEMSLGSPQPTELHWGPAGVLTYTLALHNLETEPVSGLLLELDATTGLTYEGVPAGATCGDCTPGASSWTLLVPSLGAGATGHITFTGRLGNATTLAPLQRVTTTVDLTWSSFVQGQAALSHRVDGMGPTVTVFTWPGLVVTPGPQTIYGNASDGEGSGVGLVQVRQAGGTWQPASGTLFWSAPLTMPAAGTFNLEARATDVLGNVGPITALTLVVDGSNPLVALSVPAVLTGTAAVLPGTTSDPDPPGALVTSVAVQMENTGAAWVPGTGPYPPSAGVQNWTYTWLLPAEDNVEHQLRARATDAAGNTTLTGWLPAIVDTVPPTLTLLSDPGLASVPGYPYYLPPPVLTGTVADGAGVGSVSVSVSPPSGAPFRQAAQLAGNVWRMMPGTYDWSPGIYGMQVLASDVHGNLSRLEPFEADIRYAPQQQVYSTAYPIVNISQTLRSLMRIEPTLGYSPTGTVQFYVDGLPVGSPAPVVPGPYFEFSAIQDVGPLPIGPHYIHATYSGNAAFHPHTAYGGLEIRDRLDIWRMTLTSAPNPSSFSQPVTFTARVDSGIAGILTTGPVQFLIDSLPEGPPVPLVTVWPNLPTARLTLDDLTIGVHDVQAAFLGDPVFKPFTVTLVPSQTVTHADVQTMTLTSAPNPSIYGEPVIFTATVGSGIPGILPGGTVSFTVDGTQVGGAEPLQPVSVPQVHLLQEEATGDMVLQQADGECYAVMTLSTLAPGAHVVKAHYSGDEHFNPATATLESLQQVNGELLSGRKWRPHGRVVATWSFWYYIAITNTTQALLEGITLTDTLPAEIPAWSVRVGPDGRFDGQHTVVWRIASLGPGESALVWIRAQTGASAAGSTLFNQAVVVCDVPSLPLTLTDSAYVYRAQATPTGTPGPTPTVTPTPTGPAPGPGDILLSGWVYDAMAGPVQPIAGAQIVVTACVAPALQAYSAPDGSYALVLPAASLEGCQTVALVASAAGYLPYQAEFAIPDLRATPIVDIALQRAAAETPTLTATLTATATPTATGLPPQSLLVVYLPVIRRP